MAFWQWMLFKTKLVIFQLYYDKNKQVNTSWTFVQDQHAEWLNKKMWPGSHVHSFIHIILTLSFSLCSWTCVTFNIKVVTTNSIVIGLQNNRSNPCNFFLSSVKGYEYMWLLIIYLPFCNCLQLLDHIFLRKCFVQIVLSETQRMEIINTYVHCIS